MTRPESPKEGVSFDLAALAEELRREEPYLREGQTARTLVRDQDLRVVLVVLRAGKRMLEHHASVTASVQTLSGQVSLQLPERKVELPAGELLVLGGGLRHDVIAEEDSSFLLTLGWRGSPK